MKNSAAATLLSTVSSTGIALTEDAFAEHMDSLDALQEHRAAFALPKLRDGTSFSYMAGHTLGPQHIGTEASVVSFLKKWREQGREGYAMPPNPWRDSDHVCQKDMASLVGAMESEVVVMNAHTINFHLMMSAFFKPQGARKKILVENQIFPSDLHCIQSQLETRGMHPTEDLIFVSSPGAEAWDSPAVPTPTEAFLSAIERRGDEAVLLVLSAIHFLTGEMPDVQAIVKAAHAKNIIVGLDCASAVGNVPLQLHEWGVDFACWCTYRYLNGGAGNVGCAFVHNSHTGSVQGLHYLRGWWGHESKSRLSFHHTFEPATGASAFQVSSPSPAAMAMLAPSLKLIATIGVPALREKSLLLTSYLELLLSELVPQGCLELITPADPNQRGAQLSLRILPNKLSTDEAMAPSLDASNSGEHASDSEVVQRRILEDGVMIEAHGADIISLAPSPLYCSFFDVLRAARALASVFSLV